MIDCHVHITSTGLWFDTSVNASIDLLLEELDNSPITKVILLPAGKSNRELEEETSYIASLVQNHPDKFAGLSAYYPGLKFERVIERNLIGIKIHPRLTNIDVLDSNLLPLYNEASENGMTLIFDAYCVPTPGISLKTLKPGIFSELAIQFPKLKIVLAHCGMPFLWDTFAVIKGHANVFADLSYILHYFDNTSLISDLSWIIKKVPDKFIYGSDFPEVGLNDYFRKFQRFCDTYHICSQDIMCNIGRVFSNAI